MVDDLTPLSIVPVVVVRTDRRIQSCDDVVAQIRHGGGVIPAGANAVDRTIEDGIETRPGYCRAQSPNSGRHCDDTAVGSGFEKFVLAGVDDKEVGVIPDQFFHQQGNPIGGVADPAGVDHLPPVRGVNLRQELPQPPAKRRHIVKWPPIGRRAPHAEDTDSPVALVGRERLGIEKPRFVVGGPIDQLTVGIDILDKKRGGRSVAEAAPLFAVRVYVIVIHYLPKSPSIINALLYFSLSMTVTSFSSFWLLGNHE